MPYLVDRFTELGTPEVLAFPGAAHATVADGCLVLLDDKDAVLAAYRSWEAVRRVTDAELAEMDVVP